jgi:hypothetical protein
MTGFMDISPFSIISIALIDLGKLSNVMGLVFFSDSISLLRPEKYA